MTGSLPALLDMSGIHKRFPGVHALRGIDLQLKRGEVLALVGENGAGKSTLIKTLGGAQRPDEGRIVIDGRPVEIHSPHDSQQAGIGIIYQEFNLVPHLSVRENIFLGREIHRRGVINKAAEQDRARELLAKIGVDIDPETPCGELSTAEQQIVEIAKALATEVRILVMDEPSAALTPQEVAGLFRIVRDLQSHGIAVIYISHRLDEIFEIADRVMVLRDGQHIGTRPTCEIDRNTMIEMMVGRSVENEFPKEYQKLGATRLEAKNLLANKVNDVSFSVRAGEVLGFTGLVGAGRTETMRLVFGADRRDGGSIHLDGKEIDVRSPGDAINARICLLTEDRKHQGLVLMHSVRENFGLPNLAEFSRMGVIDHARERNAFQKYVDTIGIKISDMEQIAGNLSGGNQQKIVIAKWLQHNCEVIIFDEPTRGIDVGAKYEIYMLMNQLAAAGKAIIMISSELPEVIGMSDRIIVMRNGEISGEVTDVVNTTQEELLDLAIN
jgi:ribose transport system ATP-binding protein